MSAPMTTISDERLAEIVGAGLPCVPIEPWEVAHVVQELRSLRAYRTAANPLQAVLDKFPDKPAPAIEVTDEMVDRFMVSWYGDYWQRGTIAAASFEDARSAIAAALGGK